MTQDGLRRPDYRPRRATKRGSRLPLVIGLIVAGLAAVVGLFFLGLALPGLAGSGRSSADAAASASPTPTPTPTPTGPPTGPRVPGTYDWDELGGGECLTGFTSPWAQQFTVVPCTVPHNAQLVRRGDLPGAVGSPYPGEKAINEQMTLLCTDPKVLNVDAAAGYAWMQWQAAYPPNADEWNKGDRSYYCFFNRSSGELMTTSIAVGT